MKVIDYDGRLYLANTKDRFDIVDLSLADSAGLSSPGGFAIVEKFSYSREAMASYMRALKPGGILSVTLWNKEEPPKSVLKLYATMAAAARDVDGGDIADRFFVVSTYLSTATVLYKRGGFTPEEIAKLRDHTRAMSFDEIYYPGLRLRRVPTCRRSSATTATRSSREARRSERRRPSGAQRQAAARRPGESPPADEDAVLPKCRRQWAGWPGITWCTAAGTTWPDAYVFDTRVAHQRPALLRGLHQGPATCRRSPTGSSCCRTNGASCCCGRRSASPASPRFSLVLLPLVFGWRTIFSHNPGKFRTIVYFACLGAGYIMVEVGLISKFVQALSNATVSASVLITGMLVFSGLGSFVSERYFDRARTHHAAHLPRHLAHADRLRPSPRPRARLDRHASPMRCGCCSACCWCSRRRS